MKSVYRNRCWLAVLLAMPFVASGSIAAPQAAEDPPTVNNSNLSLSGALLVAGQDNVALRQARAESDAASGMEGIANSRTKPELSATLTGTDGNMPSILTTTPGVSPENIFSVGPDDFGSQNLLLKLLIPLFTGGKLNDSAVLAQNQDEAAQLTLQATILTVDEQVTDLYTDAVLQQALVGVSQARLTSENEQVRITQEMVTTGKMAPVDLLREQAEQADAQQGLLAAQNADALALVNLKTEIGISQLSQITLYDTLDTLSALNPSDPLSLQEALNEADSQRLELTAAAKLVEAAQSGVSAARGEYAPQLYGVAIGRASTGQNGPASGYTLGLVASLPLYNGGQRRADTKVAAAALEQAQANAEQVRQTVDQQVASAWISLQTALAQVQAASAGVTAAQESYKLAILRYNAGKSVQGERLDSLAALTRAQGTLAEAKAGVILARTDLEAALGSSQLFH